MTEAFSVSTYADLCKVGTGVDGWTPLTTTRMCIDHGF